jgi:hypothetical protein
LEGEKKLIDNLEKAAAFELFIKTNKPVVIERRKEARMLAEARQTYNDKIGERFSYAGMVFDRILPTYEEGSMVEFADNDESKYLFARIQ